VNRFQNSSKYRSAGDTEEVPENMTANKFIDKYCKTLVGRCAEVHDMCLGKGVTIAEMSVWVDNAGGHGGGRGDMSNVLVRLNSMAKERLAELDEEKYRNFCVTFNCQPPNSPDNNLLDLAVWNSLATGVELATLPTKEATEKVETRLISAVSARWATYNWPMLAPGLLRVHQAVQKLVIENDGGNNFQLPHATAADYAANTDKPRSSDAPSFLPPPPVHKVCQLDSRP